MRKLILLLTFSVFFIPQTYSQGKISGRLIDAADKTPINGAAVAIYKSDSTQLIKGTYSNENGLFQFESIKYGRYMIAISFIGYNVKKVNVELNENSNNLELGDIYMQAGQPTGNDTLYTTREIEIEAEKPLMEFNDDKKVFNVDKIMTSTGGTAIDVFKKLPMLNVDANDNVTLRGSANVLILIDNKPMKFASLRQMPADAIQNVEIITNPPAKYESEGVSGIVNIVTRKIDNKGLGYNGVINTSIRNNVSNFLNIGSNIKINKWSIFLNGGFANYRFRTDNYSDITYFEPVSYFSSKSNGNGNNKFRYGGITAEYEFKNNQIIGLELYLNSNFFDNTSLTRNNNYDINNVLSSYYNNNVTGNGNSGNKYISLYYNRKYGKPEKELNIDLSYSNADNIRNSRQSIRYYDSLSNPSNNTPSEQLNTSQYLYKYARIQIDYSNPFNDKTKLEAGYKGIFRTNDNDYSFDTLNYNVNSIIRNYDITNNFKLSDYINAVYGTFSHKINKFRIKLGLRVEHTYTKGEMVTTASEFTKKYLDVFPTLSLTQKITDASDVQLSYSRRITRPNPFRLNPFVRKSNAKFFTFGNPQLSPEYSDSYEFSYIFLSNIINITPIAFYRKSYDVITSYSYLLDTNITATTYKNSATGYSYGIDFIVSSSAFKWWNLNSTFSFYKSKYNDNSSSAYSSEEGYSWKANIRSFFTFEELFDVEVFYEYDGKRINATGYSEPSQGLDISVNKSFLNKKLKLGIRAEDIFDTRKWASETNGTGVRTYYNYRWDTRQFVLTLNYNFGNTEEYYKKSKNTKRNENEKNDTNNDSNK